MDDRRKTIAALTIIVSFVVLVVIILGLLVTRSKVISPVPEEGAIRVIFVSPTTIPGLPLEASGSASESQ